MADKNFNATSITTFYTENNNFNKNQLHALFEVMKKEQIFSDNTTYDTLSDNDFVLLSAYLSPYSINETIISNTITDVYDDIFYLFCKCICSIKFNDVTTPTNGDDIGMALKDNASNIINTDAKKFTNTISKLIEKVDINTNQNYQTSLYTNLYQNVINHIFNYISDILVLMYTYDINFKKKFTLISWILISFNNKTTESYREYINSAYELAQPTDKLFAKCICKVYNFLINIYNESYYQYLIDLGPTKPVSTFGNGYDEFEGYGERKNKPNFQNMIKSYSTKYANKYNIKPKQICEMFFSSLVTSMISNDDNNIDKINKKINNYLSDKNFNEEFDDYKLHLENNITRLESKCSNYSFYDSDRE